MTIKRYTGEEIATIVMAGKTPVDDATYVSGPSSKSESCNNEEFSETMNEVLSDTISIDIYHKT